MKPAVGCSAESAPVPRPSFFPAAALGMPVSKLTAARRAFIAVLKRLAQAYAVPLALTRESTDTLLLRAYKKLLLKVHPDKGGAVGDQQKLQDAKETWQGLQVSKHGLQGT